MLFSLRGGSVRIESLSKGRQEGRTEALSLGNGLKGYVRMFSLRGEDVLVKPLRAKRQRGERKVKAPALPLEKVPKCYAILFSLCVCRLCCHLNYCIVGAEKHMMYLCVGI